MFGLKVPTVWLNAAFLLSVSQAEHLIKTHLGLNAKNQYGHLQNWRDLIFTLQRSTLRFRMIPWFSYMGLYNLLHHSGPSQLPWPSHSCWLACHTSVLLFYSLHSSTIPGSHPWALTCALPIAEPIALPSPPRNSRPTQDTCSVEAFYTSPWVVLWAPHHRLIM